MLNDLCQKKKEHSDGHALARICLNREEQLLSPLVMFQVSTFEHDLHGPTA